MSYSARSRGVNENPYPRHGIQPLDEALCPLIDGIVRYVGTEEECQRRLAMLLPNNHRAARDKAARLGDPAVDAQRRRHRQAIGRRHSTCLRRDDTRLVLRATVIGPLQARS
jgi:hypothetical protein